MGNGCGCGAGGCSCGMEAAVPGEPGTGENLVFF